LEKKNKINILISCSSRESILIKMIQIALDKFNVNSSIQLADSSNVISKFYNYKFWKIPKIKKENIKKILIGLKKRKINFIIPTSDAELSFWSSHKNLLLKNNIYAMVSNFKTIKICLDKYFFYKYLLDNKILTPHTSIKKITFKKKYLIKERFSSNQKKIPILLNHTNKKEFKNFKSPIYQEFIEGKEYSIDCGIAGSKINILIRKRIITFHGESEFTRIEKNELIKKSIIKAINLFKFEGHFMFQGIISNKDKKFYITECNARVGGMSIVSSLAGKDNVANFIAEKLKLKLKKKNIKTKNNFVVLRDIYSF
jgi:carbamoyl-phosphate synthase large subunit